MIKLLTTIFLLFVSLDARENPFFPSTGEADITMSTNEVTTLDPLKRATVTLPSTARTIESVTIRYKNLDGSIVSKTEELGNSIDWHLPVFISQNYEQATTSAKKKEKFVKIAGLKFISLYESKKRLKILTKDKLIRNFLLTKPHRIVCDFKRDIDIRSYDKKPTNSNVITKIKLGNHKGYYRVVIELDGYYKYTTKPIKNGYTFTFR